MQHYIGASKIFTGTDWIHDAVLVIEEGKISHVVSVTELPGDAVYKHYKDCFIAPAFVDIQIYGAQKKLLAVYPEPNTLNLINEYCKGGGAALFLPTLSTNTA